MVSELINLFCDLVKIPSPSGNEQNISKYIQNYLKQFGIDSYIDSTGKLNDSNTGNVIAKLGDGKPKIMFVAHMDTVEIGDKNITPIIEGSIIKSDGSTILGSDDKAGVAALLSAIAELIKDKNIPSLICVFSTREEKGLMGVKYLDVEKEIPFVFDVDGSETVGSFINKTLGFFDFELIIHGKAAHATMNPDMGINSIKTAGLFLSNINLTKASNGTTLNIGTIIGGTAPNIIPDYSKLIGEIRGFTKSEMDERFEVVKTEVQKACNTTGCTFELIKKEEVPPFFVSEESDIMKIAKNACLKIGINFKPLTLSATIQGNILAGKNYNIIGLCKGGKFPHSNSEYININEIEQTKQLIIEIVRQLKISTKL